MSSSVSVESGLGSGPYNNGPKFGWDVTRPFKKKMVRLHFFLLVIIHIPRFHCLMNCEPFRVFNLSRISFLKPNFGKIFQRKATLFFLNCPLSRILIFAYELRGWFIVSIVMRLTHHKYQEIQ